VSERVGVEADRIAAVSQLAGDEQADGADQLELGASDELDGQQSVHAVHCQRKHAVVTLLRHTDLQCTAFTALAPRK